MLVPRLYETMVGLKIKRTSIKRVSTKVIASMGIGLSLLLCDIASHSPAKSETANSATLSAEILEAYQPEKNLSLNSLKANLTLNWLLKRSHKASALSATTMFLLPFSRLKKQPV